MRITSKIASAGKAGQSRFPCLAAPIEECLNADGKLDYAKAVRALTCEQIMFSSDDDIRTVGFAMEFLKQLESVVRTMAANPDNGALVDRVDNPDLRQRRVHLTGETKADLQTSRRMSRGQHAYHRLDIRTTAEGGIRVIMSCGNPRDVVGGAEQFAHDYAVMVARILTYIKTELERDGKHQVQLVEGDGCNGIIAEACEADERQMRHREIVRRAEGRALCPNRTATGYCSPSRFDCPYGCYRNGRCVEVEG